MTTADTKLMTADELLRLPRGEGKRHELIRGVLVEKRPIGNSHGETVARVSHLVSGYSDERDFGDVRTGEPGYRLERDPDTVRAPDVAWIAPGRIPPGTQGYPQFAPDLAVEVKSPSNSNPEMAAKAQMWLCYGSKIALVLDPETVSVRICRPGTEPVALGPDDILDLGDLLPGFSTPVWRLFQRQR